MKMWVRTTFAASVMLGAAWSAPAFADPLELTMWGQGDCPPGNCVGAALVEAFEKANPDIKINLVQQPVDGYFTNLLAQSVIGRGPGHRVDVGRHLYGSVQAVHGRSP